MRFAAILGLAASALLPLSALAEGLAVENPSLVVAPVGQQAAVLLRLENRGAGDDRLIGVEAGDLARGVSLHTHVAGADGSKRMAPAEGGIAVPAGSAQVLGRGGNHALGRDGDHALFLDLARIPEAGSTVPLTLIFESGAALSLDVPVTGHPTARQQG